MSSTGFCEIGMLTEEITIQTDSNSTQDEYGEVSPASWGTHATVWARPEWSSTGSGEKLTDDLVNSKTRVDFTIHYLSTVTEVMRVSFESEIYNIRSIQREGFKEWTVLRCEKFG